MGLYAKVIRCQSDWFVDWLQENKKSLRYLCAMCCPLCTRKVTLRWALPTTIEHVYNNIVGTGGRYRIREVIELGMAIHWTILTLGPGANIELRRLLN